MYGVHFEFQAGPDAEFVPRLWQYNVLYTSKFKLPIRSVAFLLRPFDGHRAITGRYVQTDTEGALIHDFRHQVLRVWQIPPETFLTGGLALLPLAAVAQVSKRAVAGIVREMLLRFGRRRLDEAGEATKAFLESITSVETLESFADRLWDIETWAELQRPQ